VRQQSPKNIKIQEQIRQKLKRGEWATGAPLPPARELAATYEVSSSTAYRILVRLADEGVLWQHSNGRFYAAEARHLVDTVQPFACMLPRLQLWNVVLQQIMHGVTERSAQYKRGILLIHNPALIVQDDINSAVRYASAATQEHILSEFFATHANSCEGIIFDNVWKDEVLAKFRDRLKRMVVINRKTSLDFVSAVFPNFHRSALLAFAHLYGRGFEKIYFVSPHDDHYIHQAMERGVETAEMIGVPFSAKDVRKPRTPEERLAFVRELKKENRRIGQLVLPLPSGSARRRFGVPATSRPPLRHRHPRRERRTPTQHLECRFRNDGPTRRRLPASQRTPRRTRRCAPLSRRDYLSWISIG